jgi:hypothetical protein
MRADVDDGQGNAVHYDARTGNAFAVGHPVLPPSLGLERGPSGRVRVEVDTEGFEKKWPSTRNVQ